MSYGRIIEHSYGRVHTVPGTVFRDTLKDGGEGPEMVVLPTGSFQMGSPDSETDRDSDEGPVRTVNISKRIAMGRYEVTFEEYEHFADADSSRSRPGAMDLRRPEMQARLKLRSEVSEVVRRFMHREGFLDIETPILTRATPEGARDYLLPSRTHAGRFFALPQSPQLFKQLLMMSGFDRYYQIARCFRDEDLRADRQPEFTQIDIETSFLDGPAIMDIAERMVREVFRSVLHTELPPFPHMTWAEAMERFGSDKPDLRIPLELVSVDDLMQRVDFKVFRRPGRSPSRGAMMNPFPRPRSRRWVTMVKSPELWYFDQANELARPC